MVKVGNWECRGRGEERGGGRSGTGGQWRRAAASDKESGDDVVLKFW